MYTCLNTCLNVDLYIHLTRQSKRKLGLFKLYSSVCGRGAGSVQMYDRFYSSKGVAYVEATEAAASVKNICKQKI